MGDTRSVRPAVVLADDETITVKGQGVFEALRPAGFRAIYAGTMGGWVLPRRRRGSDRLPDVLAALESAGYRLRVVQAEPWGDGAA